MPRIELEFLTEDETLRQVCRQYWQVTENGKFLCTPSRIAETFGIPRSKLASSVAKACRAFCREGCCTSCGTPRPFDGRTDYTARQRYGRWTSGVCQSCRDAELAKERRESEQKAQQQHATLQRILSGTTPLSISRLSFADAVYLVSLLRLGGAEDLTFISPHDSFTTPLSPTTDFDREILDHLYRRWIIAIHPGSRSESIIFEGEEFTRFLPFKVHWTLPVPKAGPSAAKFLEEAEAILVSNDWPTNWRAASEDLHRTVALQECLQYMRVVMEEHGFEPKIGEKTLLVLKNALAEFSIGQVYGFLWRAARDAAAFYVRERTSKSHAANIVPGSIQRMAERAVAERWQVKAYRRDFRAPQSQLSQVLFTMALRLPDGGFTTIPPRAVNRNEKKEDEATVENNEQEGDDGAEGQKTNDA